MSVKDPPTEYTDLTCIKCGNGFEPAFPGENYPNLSGGLTFKAHGQFGSGLYDPMSDAYLVIAVCDSCLQAEGEENNVLECFPSHKTPPPRITSWDPHYNPYEGHHVKEEGDNDE